MHRIAWACAVYIAWMTTLVSAAESEALFARTTGEKPAESYTAYLQNFVGVPHADQPCCQFLTTSSSQRSEELQDFDLMSATYFKTHVIAYLLAKFSQPWEYFNPPAGYYRSGFKLDVF